MSAHHNNGHITIFAGFVQFKNPKLVRSVKPNTAMAYNNRVTSWNVRWPLRYLTATVIVALPITLLERLRPELSQTTIALLLVLPVVLVAVMLGRAPALYASVLAGL